MKILRWIAAGLVWIGAGLLGVLGGLLCITILLLPLGIPLLMAARRLFSVSTRLMMPAAVRHPAKETGKALKGARKKTGKSGFLKKLRKSAPEALTPQRRTLLQRIGIGR